MQITIGASTKSDAKSAVAEVAASVKSPNLLVLLSSYQQLKEASEMVAKQFPEVPMIGASTTSYYGTESSDKRMVLIGFGNDAEVEVGVIRNLSTAPVADIPAFEEKISKVRPGKEDTICLEFCTNDEERLTTTMNLALEKSGVPIVGGTIFGYPNGATPFAVVNGECYEDACCYALIRNKSGKIRTYSENIYGIREGAKGHIATKVNLANKELITLDGRPAADVYCDDAGVTKNQLVDNVLTHPLGRVIGDEIFISSPYEIGKNGSLINYKRINENDTIQVLELKDYDAINADTRARIKDENRKISFVFSVNCIYRHLLFTQNNYLTELLTNMKNVGPHVGIVGGGEQYKKQHVNQTMVCAVFE
ncbi:MAG: FIST C-terminal domain-containing protein [Lachnospiraceae bacterium]|nr:FIST C-terminal domain-containing protein [Lachnospiraceae bacterium]